MSHLPLWWGSAGRLQGLSLARSVHAQVLMCEVCTQDKIIRSFKDLCSRRKMTYIWKYKDRRGLLNHLGKVVKNEWILATNLRHVLSCVRIITKNWNQIINKTFLFLVLYDRPSLRAETKRKWKGRWAFKVDRNGKEIVLRGFKMLNDWRCL